MAFRVLVRSRAAKVAMTAMILGGGSSVFVGTMSSSASSRSAAASSNSISIALSSSVPSLNPILSDTALAVYDSVFDHLVTTYANGSIAPDLATSWSSNANSTVWNFKIRSNAKFSNGAPVTLQDIIYSYQAVLSNAQAPNQGDILDMKSLKAIGPNELQFTLTNPYSSWPIQTRGLSIVPEATYKADGPNKFALHPVGSGPYKVVSYSNGVSVKLQANPYYWGPKPAFEFVTEMPIADQTARLTALESGSVAMSPLLGPQVTVAAKQSQLKVVTRPSNLVTYLGLNINAPVMKNLKFRQAIDYAINRQAITTSILQGKGTPIGQMVAPVTFGYDPAIKPTPYDVNKAKALLKESGYNGQPIVMQWPTDYYIPYVNEVAQAVAGYLSAIGIHMKMLGTTTDTFITSTWLAKKVQDIYLFSWNPSSMDADAILQGSYVPASGVSFFNNPTIDKLTLESEAQSSPGPRDAFIWQIWKISTANEYYEPLFYTKYSYGEVKSEVAYTPRADGLVHAQDLRKP